MNTKKNFLYFFVTLCSITLNAADSIEVRIKLRSVTDILAFNQAFVPDNYQEYGWEVLIDTDNNPSTGNTGGSFGGNTGFDVALSVTHYKQAGSTLQNGSILSINTQKNTWILTSGGGLMGSTIRAFIDYTDATLVMRGSKAFAELADVAEGNRFMAFTKYYSSAGLVTDASSVSNIPAATADSENDVDYSFIDIREVTINLGTVDIPEPVDNSISINIFPNPSSGIFKIESVNIKNNSLKVFNLFGEEVLQHQINSEIDLSKSPKGIYFVRVFAGTKIFIKKIIVQ
jgi:hypothetical protein